MSQYLDIYFKEQPMGVIAWNPQRQEGRFEFYQPFSDWLAGLSPILLKQRFSKVNQLVWSFPLGKEKPAMIPSFLTDCIPGDYAMTLLRQALKSSHKTPESLSPLALFSLLGRRGKGAFRFEPHGYPELDHAEPIDISRLAKYARIVCQENGKGLSENRFRELLRSGLFTTGSWPEAFVAVNDFTGEVLSGQVDLPIGFEAWTLKLDGVLPQGEDHLAKEFEHLRKAKACGLDVAPFRQIREGNHTHLLIKRIDREKQTRIHIQSFAALRDEINDSCEEVFRCMRLLRLPYPDMVKFYKRVAFNALTGSQLEPANGIFFFCDERMAWHLAQADSLFNPSRNKSQAISINGKNNHPSIEDVLQLGKAQSIRKYADIVHEIQSLLNTVT